MVPRDHHDPLPPIGIRREADAPELPRGEGHAVRGLGGAARLSPDGREAACFSAPTSSSRSLRKRGAAERGEGDLAMINDDEEEEAANQNEMALQRRVNGKTHWTCKPTLTAKRAATQNGAAAPQ